MIEIILSAFLLLCFLVAFVFVRRYEANRRKGIDAGIFANAYIFDALPSVFPTLGIFSTALGITIGLWHFDSRDIQSSLPELLAGLKLAFIATMLGIAGLLIFSKYTAIVRHRLDLHMGQTGLAPEQEIFGKIHHELVTLNSRAAEDAAFREKQFEAIAGIQTAIGSLAETVRATAEQSDNQRKSENAAIAHRFQEFGEYLQKNNTESLVKVMEGVVEQLNKQMNELLGGLVDKNFIQLRASIDALSTWQRENKEQIQALTQHFQATTETFGHSREVMSTAAETVHFLVGEGGQLQQIIAALKAVMVDDHRLRELGASLSHTVETLERTTDKFDSTTAKLNDWVATERNFKESAEILIAKLEEFRNLNGGVWDKYRAEMASAVDIVRTTSTALKTDLDGISDTFYEQLNNTLAGLDQCIQRMVKAGASNR